MAGKNLLIIGAVFGGLWYLNKHNSKMLPAATVPAKPPTPAPKAIAPKPVVKAIAPVKPSTVPLSNDKNLIRLLVSTGTLTPAFATDTPSYTVAVPSATASIRITPTARVNTAHITLNGAVIKSGSQSPSLPLVAGANIFTMVVTAENGTHRTYKITVNRAKPGATVKGMNYFEV